MLRIWIHITLMLCASLSSLAQCATGGAEWLNGQNNGMLRDTGLLGGYITVEANTVGTMVNGRPFYQTSSSTWKGLTYASLQVFRAYSSPGSNYTSFSLSAPLDSTYFHVRVDNIRGDAFNWESQNVRGYLNGVEVPADFKDPVNGATVSNNTIAGASYTNSTVQSAMRVFFSGPVDSIVVKQTSWSDWVIVELMMQCNILLPASLQHWTARRNGSNIALKWSAISNVKEYVLERSSDGKNFSPRIVLPAGKQFYNYADREAGPGKYYYRLKMNVNGKPVYSTTLLVQAMEGRVRFFPNPFQQELQVDLPPASYVIEVVSDDGKLVGRYKTLGSTSLQTGSWKAGLYHIRLTGPSSMTTTTVVKMK